LLNYLDKVDTLETKIMDQKMITVGDYTVVGQLPPGLYQAYYDRTTERLGSGSRSYTIFSTFETLIREKVQEQVKEKLSTSTRYGALSEEETEEKAQIADLQFGFSNAAMLKLLAKRATLLTSGKFDQVAKVEAELTRIKNEKCKDFIIPVTFFITFETEAATTSALKLGEIELEGHKIPVETAPEPENIIWENREITVRGRWFRWSVVLSLMLLISIGIFAFFIKVIAFKNEVQYLSKPPGVNCDDVVELYGEDL